MAYFRCGSGGGTKLEPSISAIVLCCTTGYVYSSDMSDLTMTGNNYTGTDIKYSYGSSNYTIKAVTAGKYRVIGLLGLQGADSKIINAQANETLATVLNTGYEPTSGKYSVAIVYKVSN